MKAPRHLKEIWNLHSTRRFLIAHGLLITTALILCTLPLFNLLGYEFSLVIAFVLTLILGPITMGRLQREDANSSPLSSKQKSTPKELASAPMSQPQRQNVRDSREIGPGESFLQLAGQNVWLLLPPLLIISLNSLRVQICDFYGGLEIYAIIPGVTLLHATMAGMLSGALTNGRPLKRNLLYYGLVLLSVAGALAYLALEPPIVTVNPYLGYYAGSIYDEALSIPLPLIAYRLIQVALLGAMACAMEIVWLRRSKRTISPWLWSVGALTLTLFLFGHSLHTELGYSLDREDIQQTLGGRFESEHFIIYYPASGDWGARIEDIAEDHEFRYAQLSALFEVTPQEKFSSYIYANRTQKGQMMGARNTLVAKLWLGEMHIMYSHYGSSIVKHEMAHLFSKPFGSGPLSLSARMGILPNMGLVEGIATAAQWQGKELTPHGEAAALRRLNMAPDLAKILGTKGFWSRHNRTVYTLVGSFSRWLIDTRGIANFKNAYAEGDFETTYYVPLETLVSEWHVFLDQQKLGEDELALMKFRFDRPSIFGKICARNLAERRLQVRTLAANGRHEDAADAMSKVCKLAPKNTAYQHELMLQLIRAKHTKEAQTLGLSILASPGIGALRSARVKEDLADIDWLEGNLEKAQTLFQEVLDTPGISPATRRALWVKLQTLGRSLDAAPGAETIQDYFLNKNMSVTKKIAALYQLRRHTPQWAVPPYLLGLQLSNNKAWNPAIEELEAALLLGTLHPEITQRTQELLAKAYFFDGKLTKALKLFEKLSQNGLREGERALATDWAERVRWKQARITSQDALERARQPKHK